MIDNFTHSFSFLLDKYDNRNLIISDFIVKNLPFSKSTFFLVAASCTLEHQAMIATVLRFTVLFTALLGVSSRTINSVEELSFDDDQRTTTNYVLFLGSAKCSETIERNQLDQRQAFSLSNTLASAYFGDDSGDCAAVCIQRGTHIDHLMHPLPMHVGKNIQSVYSFGMTNCQPTEVGFLSYNPNMAYVYWVNPRGKRSLVGNLLKGEKNTFWQGSYLGHRFVIEDSVTNAILLDVTVEYDAIFHIGDHKSSLEVTFSNTPLTLYEFACAADCLFY